MNYSYLHEDCKVSNVLLFEVGNKTLSRIIKKFLILKLRDETSIKSTEILHHISYFLQDTYNE